MREEIILMFIKLPSI